MSYDVSWEVTLDDMDSPEAAAQVAEEVVCERSARWWRVVDRATGKGRMIDLETGMVKEL